jgi:hypothetical protein
MSNPRLALRPVQRLDVIESSCDLRLPSNCEKAKPAPLRTRTLPKLFDRAWEVRELLDILTTSSFGGFALILTAASLRYFCSPHRQDSALYRFFVSRPRALRGRRRR